MMGSPSRDIYFELACSTFDQFKRSWYFFVFKMPFLPELLVSAGDYNVLSIMWNGKLNQDDLEAYKYAISQKG